MKILTREFIAVITILILLISSFPIIFGNVTSDTTPSSSRARDSVFMDETVLGDFGNTQGTSDRIYRDDITTCAGTLSSTADRDWFRIDLNANPGSTNVDNISVTLDTTSAWSWYPILLVIYGEYKDDQPPNEDDLIILKTEQYYNWGTNPDIFALAYITGTYYIKLQLPFTGSPSASYQFTFNVNSVKPPDYNNRLDEAIDINAPPAISNLSVSMNKDMFDWYAIDSPPTDGYKINLSLQIEIVDGSGVTKADTNPPIDFYTVAYVMVYHEKYGPGSGEYDGKILKLNRQNKFGLNRTLDYWEFTDAERTWIGIYVQAVGRDETGAEPGYELGEGHMDGWIEYKIKRLHTVTVIPPLLTGVKVLASSGNTYQIYTYNGTYYDDNNDPPRNIYIKIDDFPAAKMTKRDKEDRNYVDGCEYVYSIDGTALGISNYHYYRIYASDNENDALGENGLKHLGPIITNNKPPFTRDSAPDEIMLYEDCCERYFEVDTVFEDSDNDTLYYSLWDEQTQSWTNKFIITDNFEIRIYNENNSVKITPKPNKYNRIEPEGEGGETVLINATDTTDPNLAQDRLFYVENPFELEVIILSVNDPPEINRSFASKFFGSELFIEEDYYYNQLNLSDIFHDPVEHDPLTFSADGNYHINVEFYPNGTINITPFENWTGTEAVTFTASDYQDSVSDVLKITVEGDNDPPILNHTPKQTAYEDEWFNITFTAFDSADGGKLVFYTDIAKKLGLTNDIYMFNEETGELAFKPTNEMVGVYDDILVEVTDEYKASDSEYVTFEIINTPDPPIPKIINPRNGSRFLTRTKIDFDGEVDDPDLLIPDIDEVLRYSWYSDNELLGTTEDLNNQILSEGIHKIIFEVSDGVFSRNTSITVEVLAYNTIDTDEDGMYDYWELYYELGYKDPRDAAEDPDSDGFTNLEEFLGTDKSPLGDDDTNPWDPENHPKRQSGKLLTDDDADSVFGQGSSYDIAIFGMASIIVLILVILIIMNRGEKQRRDRLKAKKVRLIKRQMAAMHGGRYTLKSIPPPEEEPQDITCHNCGKKNIVKTPTRPIVVKCSQCDTKGVIYD